MPEKLTTINRMTILPEYKGETIHVNQSKEVRCPYCDKLLMKGTLGSGTKVELLCPRKTCKRFLRVEILT